MSLEQELALCESLAHELIERIRSIQQDLSIESLDEPVANKFGHRLRLFRARKGFTQSDLSDNTGLSVNTIIKLENSRTGRPQAKTISKLAEALGVTEKELLGE